jgi:hypothetical protein
MIKRWRSGLVTASVLSLGFGGLGFAAGGGQRTQQPEQQQQQQLGQQQEQDQMEGLGGAAQEGEQQAQLEGEIVRLEGDVAFLRLEEGAVLPFKISEQTQLEGAEQRATGGAGQQGQQRQQPEQEQAGQQQAQKQEMKGAKKIGKHLQPGDKVSVTMTSSAGQNEAQSIQLDQLSAQEKELQGTVASKQGNWVNIEYNNALVPLKLDAQTQFEGIENQQALKEGAQVRANFRLEDGTQNVATRIEVEQEQEQQPAEGGAFEEGQQQQPAEGGAFEEGQQQQQPGQGGAYDEGQWNEEPGTGGAFEQDQQDEQLLNEQDEGQY